MPAPHASPAPSPATRHDPTRWVLLVPPLVAFLLYAPTLGFQFVWDDTYFVLENPAIRRLDNIPRFFVDPTTSSAFPELRGLYRPLRNVTYAVDCAIWGLRPAGFHLANALLHALNTALVGFLILGLFRRRGDGAESTPTLRLATAVGSLAFAVHPLATEAVCWVKSRDDLLVTTFCLLGACLATRWDWQDRPRPSDWGLLALAQAGALLSKETGVVFPVLVALVAWAGGQNRIPARDWLRPPRRRAVLVFVILSCTFNVAYIWVRYRVLGEVSQLAHPLAEGGALFWTQLRATAHGLMLLVWPGPLLADYQAFRISTAAGVSEWGALLVVGFVLAAARIACRRAPVLTLAIGWWFAAILPVSNLVPTMQFLAERFLYLGLAGPAVGCGFGLLWILRKEFRSRRAVLGVIGLLVLLLAVRTSLRIPVWADRLSLYESTFLQAPGNTRVRANYAKELFRAKRYREAGQLLDGLPPGHPTRADYAADARYLAEHAAEIEPTLQAVDSNPNNVPARLRLGTLALRAHLPETATKQFEAALRLEPANWEARAGLAVVQMRLGHPERAQETFEYARRLVDSTSASDADTSALLRDTQRQLDRGPWIDVRLP